MKIGFIPDLMIDKDIHIDSKIISLLKKTDINVVNLEAPFIKSEFPLKSCVYNKTKNCDVLKKLNIGLVSLSNNHIFDFGKEGVDETILILEKNNFSHIGIKSAYLQKPYFIIKDNLKIGVFSFCENSVGFNKSGSPIYWINKRVLTKTLTQALVENNLDHIILIFHWGVEFEDHPNLFQKELSDYLVKKFKNITIVGNHPHCIQGICNNVFFSQGHFCMFLRDNYPEKSQYGYVLIQDYKKTRLKNKIYPYKINEKNRCITMLDGEERGEILKKIIKISLPLSMSSKGYSNFLKNNTIRNYPFLTSNLLLNYLKMATYRFINFLVSVVKPLFLLIFKGGIPKLFRRSIYKKKR